MGEALLQSRWGNTDLGTFPPRPTESTKTMKSGCQILGLRLTEQAWGRGRSKVHVPAPPSPPTSWRMCPAPMKEGKPSGAPGTPRFTDGLGSWEEAQAARGWAWGQSAGEETLSQRVSLP